MYKVTSAIDHLDPNPDVVYFEDFYEAEDYMCDILEDRVRSYEDSPWEYDDIELNLINIEKVS